MNDQFITHINEALVVVRGRTQTADTAAIVSKLEDSLNLWRGVVGAGTAKAS